ncbi:hypothetical protein L1049_009817 [Liquidambar formosana]|uniref:Uncharacterized protein n=1 Tax=Liquidambar formosana TaxID=63359 RepID=A0AAP0N6E9_LIQFO
MEDGKTQPPTQLVIEASNVARQERDHQLSVVAKPSLCWSILTRLHAGAQALLWKILSEATDDSQALWHVVHMLPSKACVLLWFLALFTLILLSLLYILRCFFHFHMVKAEFLHHVGVNYLFAPWISWLLLIQSAPLIVPKTVSYLFLWWVFAVPVMMLDVKIYGQWFTTEKRFLSMVANPTSQLAVIGNSVVAQAAAKMGWKESARLSGGDHFPAMLRPACRPALFKKSMRQFNVAWWAYSFSLTFLALASTEYAKEVKGRIAPVLMLLLSVLYVLVFLGLMVFTALNFNKLLQEKDPFFSFTNEIRAKAC